MYRNITKYIILLSITLTPLFAQPWNYNFGNNTGRYTSTTPSITFLPIAPSGTARVRIGVGGSFNLENQLIPFGSGSYLRIASSRTGAANKFSIFDYNASTTTTLKFRVRFGGEDISNPFAASGSFYFFLGNGALYSDNTTFSGAQVFSGLEFVFGSTGAITTRYRSGNAWANTGLPASTFSQGTEYIIEIYANNSITAKSYFYDVTQTIAPNKWDLWVNYAKVGDDLSKAELSNNVNIDSWLFYGISSTGNVANIFLDDIDYHNDIAGTPMPVTLGSFELAARNRSAVLSWSTLNEINNSGFFVERCSIEGNKETDWIAAGFVTGHGTTNEAKTYSFEDRGLRTGQYKYRLKQIDYNGNFEYFAPSNVAVVTISKPAEFTLSQNYPNPSNPVSKIDYEVPFDGFVNITVYDVTGKAVMELVNGYQKADYYSVTFDGNALASGVYFYRVTGSFGEDKFIQTKKMMLIK